MLRSWIFSAIGLSLLGAAHAVAPEVGDGAGGPATVADFKASTPADLNAQLANWLARSFDAAGMSVQVVPQGAWGLSAAWLPHVHAVLQDRARHGDTWQLNVELTSGGAPSTVAVARFRALELKPVWVAGGPLRKGDALSCARLRQDKRVLRVANDSWQGSCENLLGLRVRRPLQAGDVLMAADMADASVIQGQQEMVVVTRLGAIEVQATGTALADARMGEKVPVRLAGQTQVIQAIVIAPGMARVAEGM